MPGGHLLPGPVTPASTSLPSSPITQRQYAPCPAPLLPGEPRNGPGDDVQAPPNPPMLRASAGAAVTTAPLSASAADVASRASLRRISLTLPGAVGQLAAR